MDGKFLDRATPPHIVTLILATATGALAMNVFLPSLPGIAKHFNADYGVVQLAVSIYLAATAVLQLGIGPASDRFGRRPVMLTCLGLFILGSIATLLAPTIEWLLAARVLQAFAAGGMVLSRAIVRDTVSAGEAASRIGYVTMGMAVVPMIGPAIGGLLDELYGWQASFLLTLTFGTVVFLIVLLDLGETNHTRSSSMTAQVKTYPELLGSRKFWGYTLTAGFTSGTFFAFLGGGPYVATTIFGLSPSQYGMYFGMLSIGYMAGNFASGRFSSRFGINRMMLTGNLISLAAVTSAFICLTLENPSPLLFFAPVAFIGVGNGMTLPNANAGIVSARPRLAGSASGLGGSIQISCGALFSIAAGAWLSPQTGVWPLLAVMLIASISAILATLFVIMTPAEPIEP
jgi:DHA1 family bicyclomycin/chloramphenicol resistance-like MFS transporter